MSQYLLALDNGTQSLRALLFEKNGELVAKAQVPFPACESPEPGWAQKPVQDYWQACVQACQQLWQQGYDPTCVAGVAVTAQRGSLVPVDAQGEPLMQAQLWLCQRRASPDKGLGVFWDSLFSLLGLSETINNFRAKSAPNWLAQHRPEVHQQVSKWLYISGYLNFKLTGKFKDAVASQVGYLPLDYKRHAWAGARDWKWKAVEIKPRQLPELCHAGELIGNISQDACRQTGIPSNTPVFAAGADKACETLGSGGYNDSVACLSFGTTATINVTTENYCEPIRFMPAYPSVVPKHFCNEIMIYRGFWMVTWYKEQFAHLEQQMSASSGQAVEAYFDELVNQVPPGSMGLVLQPYWGAGAKQPGPEAKGAVIGFGDVHTRAHLYRAILEGLNFGLKEGLGRLEKRCKLKVTELRVSGGGSQSDAAMQIAADIFGLPAVRPHTFEASGLGAAMAVAVGLNWHSDFRSASTAMVRRGRVFTPRPEANAVYERLYREVYLNMYNKLMPLYQSIRDITGYPE